MRSRARRRWARSAISSGVTPTTVGDRSPLRCARRCRTATQTPRCLSLFAADVDAQPAAGAPGLEPGLRLAGALGWVGAGDAQRDRALLDLAPEAVELGLL